MRTVGSVISTSIDDLSERIKIVYFATDRNQYGDIVKSEEMERCQVWAKILPFNARISDTPPERTNKISYRVTIRYRTDIKPDDEIIWRGRRLKILTPPYDAESRKIFLVMDCEEVVEDGT